ncbi:MAG: TIGR02391 family protein [Chloroflexia bacterium]|nr:TIGR02391 family protein [Chloroflexia bacterium]
MSSAHHAHANEAPDWLNAILDPELRREVRNDVLASDFTGVIRTSFVLLERRIRESAGLEEHQYGKDLIDRAFQPDKGILQPVSPDGGERAGLHNLLLGIFLYYRNPIAHRPVYHTPESALQVLSLIDHALRLVGEAVERSFHLERVAEQLGL